MESRDQQPWFAGKNGPVLMFKVNRRPKPQDLFREDLPVNLLQHVDEVLLFGEPVVTGRKYKRTWYLGNHQIDNNRRMLSGQIGWEKHDSTQVDAYDPDQKEWVDAIEPKGVSARSAFVYCESNHLLGIVWHSSFTDTVLANVFTILLNKGEEERKKTVADWEVEPKLDKKGFHEWLQTTQAVERVKFVAKLPNPGGFDEFDDIWKRLETLKAARIEEVIEALDPESGLEDIDSEPESAQYIAMASRAYGYITASGSSEGQTKRYDQRKKVKRVYIDYPNTWKEMVTVLGDMLEENRDID